MSAKGIELLSDTPSSLLTSEGYDILDDVLHSLGDDADVVHVLISGGLASATGLAGVFVGTPVKPTLAPNSYVVSIITASGDYMLVINRGGNSESFLFMDASAGVLYLTPYQGGLMVDLTASAPTPDNAMVHIWNATAGAVTAHTDALLVLENNDTVGIAILTPASASGRIEFGSTTNIRDGQIEYFHSSHATTPREMHFLIGGAIPLKLEVNALMLGDNDTIKTSKSDGNYYTFQAIDDDGAEAAYLEVGRVISANDPYFQLGGTNALRVTAADLIGFFAAAPVGQQTYPGAALTANYTGGDLDIEGEIISAINATNTMVNILRGAVINLGQCAGS